MSGALSPPAEIVRRCARSFDRLVSHWIRSLRAPSPERTSASSDRALPRRGHPDRQRPAQHN